MAEKISTLKNLKSQVNDAEQEISSLVEPVVNRDTSTLDEDKRLLRKNLDENEHILSEVADRMEKANVSVTVEGEQAEILSLKGKNEQMKTEIEE